jgi:hypothetical protein
MSIGIGYNFYSLFQKVLVHSLQNFNCTKFSKNLKQNSGNYVRVY